MMLSWYPRRNQMTEFTTVLLVCYMFTYDSILRKHQFIMGWTLDSPKEHLSSDAHWQSIRVYPKYRGIRAKDFPPDEFIFGT